MVHYAYFHYMDWLAQRYKQIYICMYWNGQWSLAPKAEGDLANGGSLVANKSGI